LEKATDYAAFEMAIKADYDVQTAVKRGLSLEVSMLLPAILRLTLQRFLSLESGEVPSQGLRRSRPTGAALAGER
jgi:hypothetical protein